MFAHSFMTVSMQVAILFILMGSGFAMQKAGLFGKDGVRAMTGVVLWGATPCLLVESFQKEFDAGLARSLLVFSLITMGALIVFLYLTPLIYRRAHRDEASLLGFATTFSNCGFMGIPLAQAVFGGEGAMYASVFVAFFNLVQWTLGYMTISGKGVRLKNMVLNPGAIGIIIGLPLFIFSIRLPAVLSESVHYLASLNTPLAMIIIGATLASADLRKALTDERALEVCLFRLIVLPVTALGLLYFLPVPLAHIPLCVLMIEFSAPCSANTVILGRMCGRDTELAGSCVTLSTLFSLATMPFAISAAEMLL